MMSFPRIVWVGGWVGLEGEVGGFTIVHHGESNASFGRRGVIREAAGIEVGGQGMMVMHGSMVDMGVLAIVQLGLDPGR